MNNKPLKQKSMRNFFRNIVPVILIMFLFAGSINAATIFEPVSSPANIYQWHITPAPKIIIPYMPIVNPEARVSDALKEFKNLNKSERKERIKEVKAQLKEYKSKKQSAAKTNTNQVLLVILAILLPPLAVYLHEGVINNKFWIDLILTLLFFLPGVIYALVVVLGKD